METPTIEMPPSDEALLGDVSVLLFKANVAKEEPSKLRLILPELQYLRFQLGDRAARYGGYARIAYAQEYEKNKEAKMSNNAAAKEAESALRYIEFKNVRDIFKNAYDSVDGFVTTNQTSLRLAVEEAKNNS